MAASDPFDKMRIGIIPIIFAGLSAIKASAPWARAIGHGRLGTGDPDTDHPVRRSIPWINPMRTVNCGSARAIDAMAQRGRRRRTREMEETMTVTRRLVLGGLIAAPAVIGAGRIGRAAGPTVLKISHQFPGGTIDSGDFRDRLCPKFPPEVETRTKGEVSFQIYPNSSLMKTVAQFSALRKGALDLSLYPLAYA